jgi:hypothetical protein
MNTHPLCPCLTCHTITTNTLPSLGGLEVATHPDPQYVEPVQRSAPASLRRSLPQEYLVDDDVGPRSNLR